jgi:enterochelin esterase-like enzyme
MEAAACVETRGRLSDTSVPAPLLPDPLAVRVYTPPCFDPSGSTHYPVLYLLHGQNYPITQWDDLGADEAADSLITSGEARPFLIVMPGEELDLVDVRDSRYGDALVESLVPWVDRTYPTCTQAVCRAIGGISRGAGWAVHLALRHPELFAAAGGHSLAVFTGEATHLAETLAGIPPQNVPRFTLDSGRYDRYLDSALEFEQALNRAGVAHEWYLFEGIHDDAYWQAHVGGYIRWYAEVLENR